MNINTKKGKNKYRFLFAEPPNEVIFDGLTSDEAQAFVDAIPVYREMNTSVGKYLQRFALSPRINKRIRIPYRSLFFSIENYDYKEDYDYYMIVPTMSITRWELDEISKFKERHPNVRLILLILDSLHAGSRHLPLVRDKLFSDVWDYVITYDRNDAEEFGFKWLGYTYYPQCDTLPAYEGKSDAFYLGYNKGKRNELIGEVFERLSSNGVDCDFRVIANNKEKGNIVEGLSISKGRLRYPQVAAIAKNTNCIIEVLMEGQKTQSYRYFETLTYNKKLLTNNPNIAELPYYDERYMKYFEKASDIDVEWVKKKENINYGYDGEFTQIRLIDFLKDLLKLN